MQHRDSVSGNSWTLLTSVSSILQVKMPKFIEMINGFGGYCASSSDSMEILQATPPETLVQCILTQKIIKKRFQYVKEEQILEEELLCT